MAFVDRRPRENRGAAIITVAALQAAAIYALITGLGVSLVPSDPGTLIVDNIRADPPPPTEPQVEPKQPKDPIITTTKADPDVPSPEDAFTFSDDPLDLTMVFPPIGERFLNPPLPPRPLFTPVGPQPRANPASWFTTDDYPTSDIRRGNEGRATFLLAIDARGKVTDCRITQSTGHPGLDAATCRIATQRARFDPAIDGSGTRVGGTYTNSISWVIPKR